MIERNVCDDPVKPGVKAALEPEAMEIPVNPQEAFLVNISRIFAAMNQIQGEPQHFSVIAPDELLEGQTVSRLRIPNERMIVRNLHRCVARISLECDAHPHVESHRLRLADNASLSIVVRIATAPVSCLSPCPHKLRRGCQRRVSTQLPGVAQSSQDRDAPQIDTFHKLPRRRISP
jgi:hypothetical protein